MFYTIEKITDKKPQELKPVRKSTRAVIQVTSKSDVKKLLGQQVVFNPIKSMLIVFRKPTMKATEEKVFEIKNVRNGIELENIKNSRSDDKREWRVENNVHGKGNMEG